MRIAALSAVLALCAGLAFAQQKTPAFWDAEWPDTDFSKSSVSFVEILSGGPPKDGIPALDSAQFVPVSEDSAIPEMEPVVTVELEGELPRAYPIRYLTWHEIVNDRIGDVPVSVTFCPLCNSALVFDGRYEGRELTFGVSGKLRNSDMVMYDRQTESWWQQFDGEAIVGELLGAELTQVPGWMESLGEFRARNPEGLLMVEPTSRRPYGENSAWPLERIRAESEILEEGLRITWADSGQVSALDKRRISDSQNVGTVRVFDATSGVPVVHEVVFAFAFHAFTPDGTWNVAK